MAFADAMVGAQPPAARAAALPAPTLAGLDAAARELGLVDSPLGSNAWAFGKDSTGTGAGLLVGNPHFPWAGVNRTSGRCILTVPGRLDVMGASTGHFPLVQIGFNRDVAWSHTVSTGKRFTLHELTLVPGDPTELPGRRPAREDCARAASRSRCVAPTGRCQRSAAPCGPRRWGPVLVVPLAGPDLDGRTRLRH